MTVDPALVRDFVLGAPYVGPGLLRRVEQRVLEQDTIDGPAYRTGSVIPTGHSAGKDSGHDSGLSEKTFELLVALTEWLGQGIGWDAEHRASKDLLTYLVKHRITDVHLLTRGGRFAQVRERVNALLPKDRDDAPVENLEKVQALVDYLKGWMSSDCAHAWERVASVDTRTSVFRCTHDRCGSVRYQYGEGEESQWLAV